MTPWIGVDLDGTLAKWDGWTDCATIGAPIPAMVERVINWLNNGKTVKIFTARISGLQAHDKLRTIEAIENWCMEHLGEVLPVTNIKDVGMVQLWDDRAIGVVMNTGEIRLTMPKENYDEL